MNIETVKQAIQDYEFYCNKNLAQPIAAKTNLALIKLELTNGGLEYCSHNWAIFGSSRYAGELNPTLNRPVTCSEYRSAAREFFSNASNAGSAFDFQKVIFN
jgi:hypothetical protein